MPSDFPSTNHFQKSGSWSTRWRVLWVIALSFLIIGSLQAEEKMDVDWSVFGSMPKQFDPDSHLFFIAAPDNSTIVGPNTEPANPFPNLEASAYVTAEKPDSAWFRLLGRPLVEKSAAQGVFEFEFRLVKGVLGLSIGQNDQPWNAGDSTTYAVTKNHVGVSFSPDQEVRIGGRIYQTNSISTLQAGENYRFMVKWDLASPEKYTYFLNGEPLTPPVATPVPAADIVPAEAGIDVFRITLGSPQDHKGSFFLGRIAVRPGPVDIYSPEGPLKK